MKIECSRRWGQPKLTKPKECNNKNLLGSVPFSWGEGKKPKCKVWKSDDTIYVLHRDWFSQSISWEEAISREIIKPEQYREKFVYKNNYGGVVLRNEAIISFKMPDLTEFILNVRFKLVQEFASMMGEVWTDLYALHRWEDFFEEILRLLKSDKEKTKEND